MSCKVRLLALLAVAAMLLTALAVPAMADDLNCNNGPSGPDIRCNGNLFEPANNNNDFFVNDSVGDGFFFNPFLTSFFFPNAFFVSPGTVLTDGTFVTPGTVTNF